MPIYDQTFRRYEGDRTTRVLWWPVARNTVRPVLKNKLTWGLLLLLLIAVVVMSVGFFAAAKMQEIAPQHAEEAMRTMRAQRMWLFGKDVKLGTMFHLFINPLFALLTLLLLVTGAGAVSTDLRHSALPLYFSRPLKPWQYALGKVAGLAILPATAMSAAIMILYLQFIAYFGSGFEVLKQLPVLGAAVLQITMVSVFLALALAAFSSMTKTSRTAGVLFLGFLVLTFALANIFAETANAREFRAIAPRTAFAAISRAMLQPDLGGFRRQIDEGLRLTVAVSSILFYTALFLILLRRNLRVVEVVK